MSRWPAGIWVRDNVGGAATAGGQPQVVAGAGRWLIEEAPHTVIPAIIDFIG